MRVFFIALPFLILAGCSTESPTQPTPIASNAKKMIPDPPPAPYFHETAAAARPLPLTPNPSLIR
jgi:hypothetical protein